MSIKPVSAAQIRASVIEGIGEIYCRPTAEAAKLLQGALDIEQDELARDMLSSILLNHQIALRDGLPLCQDTGLLIVFADLGQNVHIEGGVLEQIISEAAATAWQKFHLRDSIAPDPLRRMHCGEGHDHPEPASHEPSKLPVVLHLEQVPGDELTLYLALKGGGAENCSALKMFLPCAAASEIEEFVVQTVVEAGGKACPPVFVGVGIGGDFESCAILAKRALMSSGTGCVENEDMAGRILSRINQLGGGVMGFAGSTTALKVSILTRPCHIASLPVAVNIDCHAHRLTTRVI